MPFAAIALGALRDLDRELAWFARSFGARRLRIGEALVRMADRSWHHELGFSSLTAYALERCGQKARWAAESCWMAKKLTSLPVLRAALVEGVLSWSMVELLARGASPENEREFVLEATRSTVRQMRQVVAEQKPAARAALDEEPSCVLTMTDRRRRAKSPVLRLRDDWVCMKLSKE